MSTAHTPDLDVVGIGLSTVDVLMRLSDLPTWERGGRFADITLDGGGMVGTALVAASRLGLACGYVGTAGSDEMAGRKLSSLSENRVDISRVVKRPGPEKSIVMCYVHQSTGERTFAGREGLSDDPLRPEELDRDYITSAQFLHLDGFHAEAALHAARWMREAGKTVVYDGSKTGDSVSESPLRILEFVDVLICGERYLRAWTGISDVYEAGREALRRGIRVVVETRGAQGSFTVTAEDSFHTPVFPVDVVDTTGAGDVFHGAYIAGLKRGWSPRETARYATAMSAINCTHLGGRNGIPTHEAVMKFLACREQKS